MKKLIIASMTLVVVLGLTQYIARSAINKGVMTNEAGTNYKSPGTGNVNASTQKKFSQNFGTSTNSVWEKSESLDKVTFIKDGYEMVAYYNSASRLVGTSTPGMPVQVLTDINNMYKDYSVESIIFFDKNEANAISKLVYRTKLKEENYLVELSGEGPKIIVMVQIKGGKSVINQI